MVEVIQAKFGANSSLKSLVASYTADLPLTERTVFLAMPTGFWYSTVALCSFASAGGSAKSNESRHRRDDHRYPSTSTYEPCSNSLMSSDSNLRSAIG